MIQHPPFRWNKNDQHASPHKTAQTIFEIRTIFCTWFSGIFNQNAKYFFLFRFVSRNSFPCGMLHLFHRRIRRRWRKQHLDIWQRERERGRSQIEIDSEKNRIKLLLFSAVAAAAFSACVCSDSRFVLFLIQTQFQCDPFVRMDGESTNEWKSICVRCACACTKYNYRVKRVNLSIS